MYIIISNHLQLFLTWFNLKAKCAAFDKTDNMMVIYGNK